MEGAQLRLEFVGQGVRIHFGPAIRSARPMTPLLLTTLHRRLRRRTATARRCTFTTAVPTPR